MKKIALGLLFGLAIFIIVTVSFNNTQQGNQGELNRGPIKIGTALALSGFASSWGEGELYAIKLAIDETNKNGGVQGSPIELIVEDIESDDTKTANAINKLITIDTVQVIIGPTWGETFAGGIPIAEENKVTMVSPSASIEIAESETNFEYFFSTFWPLKEEILTLQRYLLKNAKTKVVIINDTGAFNTAITDIFKENSKVFDISVIDQIEVPISTKDYRTALAKAKLSNPDVIFVEIEDISKLGNFMKQTKELKIKQLILSTASAQNENLISQFPEAMENMTYSYPSPNNDNDYSDFVAKYKNTYGKNPGPSSINAYNATNAVLKALKTGARTGTEIKNALYKLPSTNTGTDNVFFNDKGQILDAKFEIRNIRNGEFTTIE